VQVNPSLTWRDAQHLTIRCGHVANLHTEDWAVNGVGRNYSHNFGYGIMDATCMVRLAKQWKNVAEQKACKVSAERLDLVIPGRSASKTQLQFKGCTGVQVLEHVQVQNHTISYIHIYNKLHIITIINTLKRTEKLSVCLVNFIFIVLLYKYQWSLKKIQGVITH